MSDFSEKKYLSILLVQITPPSPSKCKKKKKKNSAKNSPQTKSSLIVYFQYGRDIYAYRYILSAGSAQWRRAIRIHEKDMACHFLASARCMLICAFSHVEISDSQSNNTYYMYGMYCTYVRIAWTRTICVHV